jgi:hypothetical protein
VQAAAAVGHRLVDPQALAVLAAAALALVQREEMVFQEQLIQAAAAAEVAEQHLALVAQGLSLLDMQAHNAEQAALLHHRADLLFIHLHLQEHTQHESFCKSTRRQSHTSHCGRA